MKKNLLIISVTTIIVTLLNIFINSPIFITNLLIFAGISITYIFIKELKTLLKNNENSQTERNNKEIINNSKTFKKFDKDLNFYIRYLS